MSIVSRARVREEHSEAMHRLSKLKRFLGSAPFFESSADQRRLLESQASVMQQYVLILEERLRLMK